MKSAEVVMTLAAAMIVVADEYESEPVKVAQAIETTQTLLDDIRAQGGEGLIQQILHDAAKIMIRELLSAGELGDRDVSKILPNDLKRFVDRNLGNMGRN